MLTAAGRPTSPTTGCKFYISPFFDVMFRVWNVFFVWVDSPRCLHLNWCPNGLCGLLSFRRLRRGFQKLLYKGALAAVQIHLHYTLIYTCFWLRVPKNEYKPIIGVGGTPSIVTKSAAHPTKVTANKLLELILGGKLWSCFDHHFVVLYHKKWHTIMVLHWGPHWIFFLFLTICDDYWTMQ